jgi:hypothetical protein
MSEIAPGHVPEAFRLAGAVIPIVLDLEGAMSQFGPNQPPRRKAPGRRKEK